MHQGRESAEPPWIDAALDGARGGLWYLDVASQNVRWTAGLESLLGVETYEGTLDAWLAIVHPDDRERAAEAVRNCIDSGCDLAVEYRLAALPNRWLEAQGQAIRSDSGEVEAIAGLVMDTSRRRGASEALVGLATAMRSGGLDALQLLVSALASIIDASFTFIAEIPEPGDGRVRAIVAHKDGAPLAPFDYDLAGTPCAAVTSGTADLCVYTKDVQQRFPRDVELAELGMVGYAGVPIRDFRGDTLGLLVAMWRRPVSEGPLVSSVMRVLAARTGAELERLRTRKERKAREARLARQREALVDLSRGAFWRGGDRQAALDAISAIGARTLEVSRLGIWTFDADQTRVTIESQHAIDLDPMPATTSVARADAPSYFSAVAAQRALAVTDVASDPRTAELADEYFAPLGITSSLDAPVRVEGRLTGLICCEHVGPCRSWADDEIAFAGSLADVVTMVMARSERDELEQRLQHAQRLESVGRLAGGLAHDFNNLLTVIDAAAELAQLHEGDEDSSVVDGFLAEIIDASARASRLTRQLLTFARHDSVDVVTIDLNAAVLESQRILRRVIGEQIELVLDLHPTPLFVRTGSRQLEQLIMNLVVNARDAMPDGGRVVLSTHVGPMSDVDAKICAVSTALDDGSADDHAWLTIADAGTGMSEEVLAHIFEPFFTTKETALGSGLGLATCYGIVRQAGGNILVDSEVGTGSTFRVCLPLAEDAAAGLAPSRADVPLEAGHEVVLLVEDEPGVRRALARGLRHHGYQLLVAEGPDTALHLARQHRSSIAIIVSDVVMPGKSGLELADDLHEVLPEAPVLFMSGYTADEQAGDKLDSLHARLLRKPFTPATLAAAIRQVLDDART